MNVIINAQVVALAARLGLHIEATEGLVGLLRVVDELRRRGYVIVLKWDGERSVDPGDHEPFTAIITGGDLAGEFFRRDDETLEGALEYVLAGYAHWAN